VNDYRDESIDLETDPGGAPSMRPVLWEPEAENGMLGNQKTIFYTPNH
jgi:hypothetical protein